MAEDLTFGRDVRAVFDADELWSAVTGIGVVYQDAIHRITTNTVLGPNGEDWGKDVRQFVGLPAATLTALQPTIVAYLLKDERISRAEVVMTPLTTNGLVDMQIDVTCWTALGPFRFVGPVSQLSALLEAQAA